MSLSYDFVVSEFRHYDYKSIFSSKQTDVSNSSPPSYSAVLAEKYQQQCATWDKKASNTRLIRALFVGCLPFEMRFYLVDRDGSLVAVYEEIDERYAIHAEVVPAMLPKVDGVMDCKKRHND